MSIVCKSSGLVARLDYMVGYLALAEFDLPERVENFVTLLVWLSTQLNPRWPRLFHQS